MDEYHIIGKSVIRKEALDKVNGRAKYMDDKNEVGMLHVKLVTSKYAHAYIEEIDTKKAWGVLGVRNIVTGKDFPYLVGGSVVDRPPLAFEKVRYFGEPIAMVIADSEAAARKAVLSIHVTYKELPVVNSPIEAYRTDAPLVHERLGEYKVIAEARPEPNTNIATRTKVRKGNIQQGFAESDVIVEEFFSFPQSDHAAMETRCAIVEIKSNGDVIISSSSQAPFEIKKQLSQIFGIDDGNIQVHIPLVGGAYGGKTMVQLEILAYLASKAVGGRKIKLRNSREADFITSPVHIGLQAKVKLGCTKEGKVKAAELLFLFDGGAYADRAVVVSKAAGLDCTGPYSIDNVWCDSLCMYTNHPYATAFRGFGHSEYTFVVERTVDIMAKKLGMCPLEFRLKNAIKPGDTTPTNVLLTRSNVGDPAECLRRLKKLIGWENGAYVQISDRKVRAKGISFAWKNSTAPQNAGAGAIVTFNENGSVNINCGAVEIGQGTKTVLAQMVAEKMKMGMQDVHIKMEVDTHVAPKHWKTAASRTTYLVGNAVLAAAEDAIRQLKECASVLLGYSAEELDVANKKVFVKDSPRIAVDIFKIALGYIDAKGNVISPQVVGRGVYVFEGITEPDMETGQGQSGPEWGIAAQAVEVELDTRDYTYILLRAVSVVDAGKVLNPKGAETQITGAMSMGLSFATREAFSYDQKGRVLNNQFRTYKVTHYGQQPKFEVEFVENPHDGSPFGSRALGEHGILGMPAALANSLSTAANVSLQQLPLTPELIWEVSQKEENRLV
ncbi:xanthine dehydrogenase family protein molybdopterin-binding subunit [Bacillus sp. 165]|uniref:xanthine dehydrogenase family protein molybdopterin-binding subunit n=1 Tax=Bacillus sp. 165 TaxID=1529117 RepID=UPI001AD967A9|nr:xanthine dehydrogenase family protein molybdopterin-binding subunit [Bacillus sp. 165]MBO9129432.1 xanthine dehydrogenase family protein molybdopterin-binding subunit [Bacillus sp. 165]